MSYQDKVPAPMSEHLYPNAAIPAPPDPAARAAVARTELLDLLMLLETGVAADQAASVAALRKRMETFEVSVSLVGQIKAGKTALANMLIGKHDMLPSDVNPWTSVVTSVHLNVPRPRGHSAVFTFFTREEWDSMTSIGGRMGEMAGRADFDEEAEEIRAQVVEMQRKAQERLGRNFEYLLGSNHAYVGYHPELLRRYVCLGAEDREGQFADLTRTADLYVEDQHWSLPTVIRDMPGVNDPFLVREAVTLENLGASDLCVIVLNATQAFSTADIALVRILQGMRNEQIILYVNRADELGDPHADIVEIDAYIRHLLAEFDLPKDLPIVFGSAAWAELTLFAPMAGEMAHRAMPALEKLVAGRIEHGSDAADRAEPGSSEHATLRRHDLSGLDALRRVIADRSARDVALPAIREAAREAVDIAHQAAMLLRNSLSGSNPIRADLDLETVIDRLDAMLKTVNEECARVTETCSEAMLYKMSEAFFQFTDAETKALERLLAGRGDPGTWAPNAEALRLGLTRAYDEFRQEGRAAVANVFSQTAAEVKAIYAAILADGTEVFDIAPPEVPSPGTPTVLMRTTTFDLSGNWLSGWLARRIAPRTYVKRFADLASAELHETKAEIQDVHVANFLRASRMRLHGFLSEHVTTLQGLLALDDDGRRAQLRRQLGVEQEIRDRIVALETIVADLGALGIDAEDMAA